ncbi:DUF1758 domain-containing protein [Trichonephila clavipes]|nr:DUF1758 domain-containing protein [Trichonephila clavipes]
MYVDDWITGQDTREEALLMSCHAKNIMKEAGMEMRKRISNDTALMAQWVAEGFDTYPMDAFISLGTSKTKVLGMAWQTLDNCLTLDTKGQDNTSDFFSRRLSVDTLISNNKWWNGPAFLRTDELPETVSEFPELNEVHYFPELKSKDS